MIMTLRGNRKRFSDLNQQEILALAISSEEDDAQIYRNWARFLSKEYPATAAVLEAMAEEEDEHRRQLIDAFRERFGDAIPVVRREHIAGYYSRRPAWMMQNLTLQKIREEAAMMEHDAAEFYARAAQTSTDAGIRKLLGDLAAAERNHEARADELIEHHLPDDVRAEEDAVAHREFVLTWI